MQRCKLTMREVILIGVVLLAGCSVATDSANAGFGISADIRGTSSAVDSPPAWSPLRKTAFSNQHPIQTLGVEADSYLRENSVASPYSRGDLAGIRQQQISRLPRLMQSFLMRDGIDDLISSTSVQPTASEVAVLDVLRQSMGAHNTQNTSPEVNNRSSSRNGIQDWLDGVSVSSRLSLSGRELAVSAGDRNRSRIGAASGSVPLAIPEPGSLAVWVGLGLFGLRRSMRLKRPVETSGDQAA